MDSRCMAEGYLLKAGLPMRNCMKSTAVILVAIVCVTIVSEHALAEPLASLVLSKKKKKTNPRETAPSTAETTTNSPTVNPTQDLTANPNVPPAPSISVGMAVISTPVSNTASNAFTASNTGTNGPATPMTGVIAPNNSITTVTPGGSTAATTTTATSTVNAGGSVSSFTGVNATSSGIFITQSPAPDFSQAIVPNNIITNLNPQIIGPPGVFPTKSVNIVSINGQQTIAVSNNKPPQSAFTGIVQDGSTIIFPPTQLVSSVTSTNIISGSTLTGSAGSQFGIPTSVIGISNPSGAIPVNLNAPFIGNTDFTTGVGSQDLQGGAVIGIGTASAGSGL